MKKILIKHIGNMGDMIFFAPPLFESIKKTYPDSHITFLTAWGYKEHKWSIQKEPGAHLPTLKKTAHWGPRNQSGFSLALIMTNPHIDQLVHYHTSHTDLKATTCQEDGQTFPTWSEKYYQTQKKSNRFNHVFEIDFGIGIEDNPLEKIYESIPLSFEHLTNYKIYLTPKDKDIGEKTIQHYPKPRIVLIEGLEGTTTRGWDPQKVTDLEIAIKETYGVSPIWFGGRHTPYFQGKPLTLRQNIARLSYCDAAIGVLSGPLHFAAAVGLPTLTLYCDQPIHRAAPSFFLNTPQRAPHHTLLGPMPKQYKFLKEGTTQLNLTGAEWARQNYKNWQHPGQQSTKSCLSVITVDEVMAGLHAMLSL